MIEILRKVIPPEVLGPVLLVGIVWAALNLFAIAPEYSARKTALSWHAQCVSWIDKQDRLRIAKREEERATARAKIARIKAAARKAHEKALEEIARIGNMTQSVLGAPLQNLMNQLTGGDFVGQVMSSIPMPKMPSDADLKLPKIPDALPAPDPVAQGDTCSCVINKATAETRLETALFTGTLTLYTPEKVAGFDERLKQIAATPACSAL